MRFLLIALTPMFTAGSLCCGFLPGFQQVALLVFGLRARGQTARFHSRGVFLSALSHFAWFPLYAAAAAALPNGPMGTVGAAAIASFIHGAILAPYALFVPAHLTLPEPERRAIPTYPMPNLDRALAQWDRLSWGHRLGLLALRIAPVVAGFALFFVCRQWLPWWSSFALSSLAYGVGVFAYAEAAASAHLQTRRPQEVAVASPRYLTLPALSSVLLGGVVIALGLMSTTEASPMAVYDGPREGLGAPVGGEGMTLPGTDVHIQPAPGRVFVETTDGGGAGDVWVREPPWRGTFDEEVYDVWFEEHPRGFEVIYQDNNRNRWGHFTIDRTGVRTDDGLAPRLRHGLGLYGLLFFGLGLLLIAISVWLLTSAARVRRRLSAIRSAIELESPECTGAIEGTFHGEAYNVSAIEGRKIIQVKGSGEVRAHLGGGILRFRLPDEGTQSIGTPKSGESVTLTGVFPKLQAQLREGALEWPSDALLITGDKAAVAEGMLQRAIRPAMLVLLGANILWVASLVSIYLHRS
ncbi:MAG: MFS family permease [Polyangiales bacterium]